MMFKVISMHTKPLKHTKTMQLLTNYIKNTVFQRLSQMSQNGKTFKNSHSHMLHAPSYGCFLPFEKYKTSKSMFLNKVNKCVSNSATRF